MSALSTPNGAEDELYGAMFRRSAGINPRLEGTWHALWLTTVEDDENVNTEELSFRWHRDTLQINSATPGPENPKGGYLWRAECRLHDNQYIRGTYASLHPINRSKGTLYLVLHRPGAFMLGHWVGANYDSDWAHGPVAIARDAERLPALLRNPIASFPAMPYWGAPLRRAESERPEREPA
jgi:hypothetical protein